MQGLRWKRFVPLGLLLLAAVQGAGAQGPTAGSGSACSRHPLAVQVLGSGGPVADDGRASSGYLVWESGRARVLVDAGSGVFTRFGEAGASFSQLDLLALSHFHTDHAASLPALLKSGYFSNRRRPLTVAGPSGAGPFPPLEQFLFRLLDRRQGVFAYLSGYLDGSDGLVKLEPVTVDSELKQPVHVYDGGGLTVEALPVPHGIVPALAFRVAVAGHRLVFGSDQNGGSAAFVALASDADLLVLHAAIPERAGRTARSLHATPSRLGEIARNAQPKQLVISHWMARSLRRRDAVVAAVAARYGGPLHVAEDLACFPLVPASDVQ